MVKKPKSKEQQELEENFKKLQEGLAKQPFKSFFDNNIDKNVINDLKREIELLKKRVKMLENDKERYKY